jgi:hypothetical protein
MESDMHGQIVKFREDLGVGVIKTDDGRKYRFTPSQIQNPNGKLVGYDVDFLLDVASPKDIILMHGTPWTAFGAKARG